MRQIGAASTRTFETTSPGDKRNQQHEKKSCFVVGPIKPIGTVLYHQTCWLVKSPRGESDAYALSAAETHRSRSSFLSSSVFDLRLEGWVIGVLNSGRQTERAGRGNRTLPRTKRRQTPGMKRVGVWPCFSSFLHFSSPFFFACWVWEGFGRHIYPWIARALNLILVSYFRDCVICCFLLFFEVCQVNWNMKDTINSCPLLPLLFECRLSA